MLWMLVSMALKRRGSAKSAWYTTLTTSSFGFAEGRSAATAFKVPATHNTNIAMNIRGNGLHSLLIMIHLPDYELGQINRAMITPGARRRCAPRGYGRRCPGPGRRPRRLPGDPPRARRRARLGKRG